jgi:beta-lysine 5,6-aminomutase alpha subunit
MLTEALHTPFLHDRWLALDQARTIRRNARHLSDEIEFRPSGRIVARAHHVLAEAERLLEEIARRGLFSALADGLFADTKRRREGGRGYDGTVRREEGYENPFLAAITAPHAEALR